MKSAAAFILLACLLVVHVQGLTASVVMGPLADLPKVTCQAHWLTCKDGRISWLLREKTICEDALRGNSLNHEAEVKARGREDFFFPYAPGDLPILES